MRYSSRAEVEHLERSGCEVIEVNVGSARRKAARVLSEFWLVLEEDNSAFTPHMLRGEGWESWNTLWISQHMTPGNMFIDAGANVGYFTLQAASHGMDVVSYEPNGTLHPLIRKSISMSGFENRVTLIKAGLGDVESELELGIPGVHSGSASFRIKDGEDVHFEKSQVYPLDNDLHLFDGRMVDVVKVDTEGFEPEVWRGAKEFRREHPEALFFMEFSDATDRSFIDDIEEEGYAVTEVDFSGNEVPLRDHFEAPGDLTMIVARRK